MFVPCPNGHRLVKVVHVRGAGPQVIAETSRRGKGRYVVALADLLSDTLVVDQGTRFSVDRDVPCRCPCKPTRIPAEWLEDRWNRGDMAPVWHE
jgi:hypothetical protein